LHFSNLLLVRSKIVYDLLLAICIYKKSSTKVITYSGC
jgi:hypothetical protein